MESVQPAAPPEASNCVGSNVANLDGGTSKRGAYSPPDFSDGGRCRRVTPHNLMLPRTSAPDPRLPRPATVRRPGGRRSDGIPSQRSTASRQDGLVADERASAAARPPGAGAGRLRVAAHTRFRTAGGAQRDGRAHGGDALRVTARAPGRACRYGRRSVLPRGSVRNSVFGPPWPGPVVPAVHCHCSRSVLVGCPESADSTRGWAPHWGKERYPRAVHGHGPLTGPSAGGQAVDIAAPGHDPSTTKRSPKRIANSGRTWCQYSGGARHPTFRRRSAK